MIQVAMSNLNFHFFVDRNSISPALCCGRDSLNFKRLYCPFEVELPQEQSHSYVPIKVIDERGQEGRVYLKIQDLEREFGMAPFEVDSAGSLRLGVREQVRLEMGYTCAGILKNSWCEFLHESWVECNVELAKALARFEKKVKRENLEIFARRLCEMQPLLKTFPEIDRWLQGGSFDEAIPVLLIEAQGDEKKDLIDVHHVYSGIVNLEEELYEIEDESRAHLPSVDPSSLTDASNTIWRQRYQERMRLLLKDHYRTLYYCNDLGYLVRSWQEILTVSSCRLPKVETLVEEALKAQMTCTASEVNKVFQRVWDSSHLTSKARGLEEREIHPIGNEGFLLKENGQVQPYAYGAVLHKGERRCIRIVHNLVDGGMRVLKEATKGYENTWKKPKKELEELRWVTLKKNHFFDSLMKGGKELKVMMPLYVKGYRVETGLEKSLHRSLLSGAELRAQAPSLIQEYEELVDDFLRLKGHGAIDIDIKLENCVFSDKARLIDLDELWEEGADKLVCTTSCTLSGDYRKLKQRGTQDIAESIAVFQMGVLFYELLGLCLPFQSSRSGVVIDINGKAEAWHSLQRRLGNQPLIALIFSMLEEQERRPSMEAVKQSLQSIKAEAILCKKRQQEGIQETSLPLCSLT